MTATVDWFALLASNSVRFWFGPVLAILIGVLVKRASRHAATGQTWLGFQLEDLNIWPELMVAAGFNLIAGITDLAESAKTMTTLPKDIILSMMTGMILLVFTPVFCWILAGVSKKQKSFGLPLLGWAIPPQAYLGVAGLVAYYLCTSVSTNVSRLAETLISGAKS